MYKPKYFTLEELCYSKTAEEKKIKVFPDWEIVEHLNELTEKILDPLREAWGGVIFVHSGYRNELLNQLVGGVYSSAHKIGYAADLYPGNGAIDKFVTFAVQWLKENRVQFDQAIVETEAGKKWLHIGLYNSKKQQRKQIFNLYK